MIANSNDTTSNCNPQGLTSVYPNMDDGLLEDLSRLAQQQQQQNAKANEQAQADTFLLSQLLNGAAANSDTNNAFGGQPFPVFNTNHLITNNSNNDSFFMPPSLQGQGVAAASGIGGLNPNLMAQLPSSQQQQQQFMLSAQAQQILLMNSLGASTSQHQQQEQLMALLANMANSNTNNAFQGSNNNSNMNPVSSATMQMLMLQQQQQLQQHQQQINNSSNLLLMQTMNPMDWQRSVAASNNGNPSDHLFGVAPASESIIINSKNNKTPTGPVIPTPLRALSAYNFFFRYQRERILNNENDDHNTDSDLEDDSNWNTDRQEELLQSHWNRDRTVKRRHRKSHGKISFADLSKKISTSWKRLPEQRKDFFREVASKDWARYHRELTQHKLDLTAAAGLRASDGGGNGGRDSG